MLLNYFKLSFRLLIRNPFITIVNVFGLSLGFALFFILWQYSQHNASKGQSCFNLKHIDRFISVQSSQMQLN